MAMQTPAACPQHSHVPLPPFLASGESPPLTRPHAPPPSPRPTLTCPARCRCLLPLLQEPLDWAQLPPGTKEVQEAFRAAEYMIRRGDVEGAKRVLQEGACVCGWVGGFVHVGGEGLEGTKRVLQEGTCVGV